MFSYLAGVTWIWYLSAIQKIQNKKIQNLVNVEVFGPDKCLCSIGISRTFDCDLFNFIIGRNWVNHLNFIMYGQKQIIQCAAVAIVLFILSFHRSALKQNREVTKARMRRSELLLKVQTQSNREGGAIDELALNLNLTGYCLKNPFSINIFSNYDNNSTHCHPNCFDKFEIWLRRQCQANCCVLKSTISITRNRPLNIDSVRKSKPERTRCTHGTTALIVYNGEKGAGLYNSDIRKTTNIWINKRVLWSNNNWTCIGFIIQSGERVGVPKPTF